MTQNEKHHKNFDVTIIGGGLVGMATALVLSDCGLSVNLVEAIVTENSSHPGYDDRTLVVNQASICFWKNTGVWDEVIEDIIPVKKVHVSNKGHFGSVTFDASEFNTSELAFIVEAKKLGFALKKKISNIENINISCPARLLNFKTDEDSVTIQYELDHMVYTDTSRLMIAADGIQSGVRKHLNLETQIKSYNRTAIICNITPEYKHNFCAFERLSKTGPTAMLPFENNRCGFVWSVKSKNAKKLLSLTDVMFLNEAQKQFGYRLGRFLKVGKRSSYPLYLVKVPRQISDRVLLMGNAAHGMSPVSAQGLNLAVRDIANLVQVISEEIKNNNDIGNNEVLEKYQRSVSQDQNQTMQYTDDLMGWFRLDEPVINKIRSLGLFTLQQLSPVKKALYTRASGYRGHTPGLLRKK